MRALLEGRLELTQTLAEDFYDCLACRGCESVCPAGVPVGNIMEDVRGLVTEARSESGLVRWVKRLLLSGLVARPRRLAGVIGLLRLYQASGCRRLVRWVLGRMPGSLASRERLLPPVPPASERRELAETWPADGTTRKRVGLFTGCIAAHLFADVNRATARVLQRNGFEVVVPRDQGCCGALHVHNGLPGDAAALARANVEAFAHADVEAVIVNAAGCGAALAEYDELLHGIEGAAAFAGRVVDVSVFLISEGFQPPRAPPADVPIRVAYDAPCHLFHAQRVKNEPSALLSSIPGVELVEFRDPERCCGSAGIYNVTHYDMSMKVLDEKMANLGPARPDCVATGNPGCNIQLSEGLRRSGMGGEVLHPVVLLERAYEREDG